jgi:hypothetical protein
VGRCLREGCEPIAKDKRLKLMTEERIGEGILGVARA